MEALQGLVDEAVEAVRQDCFRQFMALRTDPGAIHARARAAEQVGQRIKATLRDLTYAA